MKDARPYSFELCLIDRTSTPSRPMPLLMFAILTCCDLGISSIQESVETYTIILSGMFFMTALEELTQAMRLL